MSAATPSPLLLKLLAQRERTVEVAPGKRLRVRRPAETDMAAFRHITVDMAVASIVGWDGFTEADILGPAVGASDAVEFDAAVCGALVRDSIEWTQKVIETLAEAITGHLDKREAAAKN